MQGLFITGTDTGVGKTYIGTALTRSLTSQGQRVRVRKPVESGCAETPEGLLPADAAALHAAAGACEPLDRVCRYRLRHALSPELAARIEGVDYRLADLRDFALRDLPPDDFLLVEGAGGFYSPLAADGLNADLAERLRLPVLLVVADRLGCINHALLSLEAIEARGLRLAGLVMNTLQAPDPEQTGMDNAGDLERLTGQRVIRGGRDTPPKEVELMALAQTALTAAGARSLLE
jgi:dethiobiotin synthetase